MIKIIMKSMACFCFIGLLGCNSITPAQMSTVSNNQPGSTLGDGYTTVESAPSYSMTGGGGL